MVNNATKGGPTLGKGKFWEQNAKHYDGLLDVGCRSHFICSTFAARDMIARKEGGLILNISSFGAIRPYAGVAYAMGKTAIDRMTADSEDPELISGANLLIRAPKQ